MSGRAILLAVEARRPASWLLLLAALGGASVAGSGRVEGMPTAAVGFLLGGLLAVAALGDRGPAPAGHLGGAGMGMVARIVWPLIGGIVGALASPAGPSLPALAGFLLGIGFAALLSARFQRELTNRADVASSVLLITAGVGLAGGWGWNRFPDHGPAAGSAMVVAVVATVVGAATAVRLPVAARKPRGTGRLIASGEPARGRLDLCGMAVALTAMVVCLFLAPDAAATNVVVALACFLALAVPEATLSPVEAERGWSRLMGSVPVRGPGGRFGMTGLVSESVGFHALMLGWPSLVAFLLLAGDRDRSAGALATVAALSATAAITWGTVSLLRRRVDGGTTMAAVVALLIVVWMIVVSSLPLAGPVRAVESGRSSRVGPGDAAPPAPAPAHS